MRLIDADELEFFAANYYNDSERLCVLGVVEKLPTVEAEPVRHGKWKHVAGMNSKCSECGRYFPVKEFETRPFDINYCPHCGAKMDKEDNP